MITELRRYRLKAGQGRVVAAVLRGDAGPERAPRHPRRVCGLDAETNTFVWLRSFADEADRARRKDAFYGDAWWSEREAFAMDHVLEYDVTFLDAAIVREGGELAARPCPAGGERGGSRADAPPDGWSPSTRRTFVPDPDARP